VNNLPQWGRLFKSPCSINLAGAFVIMLNSNKDGTYPA